MTTLTTGTQGPQIRLVVLIGIAIAALGVSAMIALNRPTTTAESTQQVTTEATNDALLEGITLRAEAFEQAIADGGVPGQVASATTGAGATDRVAPLPDSIADMQDRAMAQARIADREAAASAVGGPVADAVLGNATGATDRVAPLSDSLADAQDRAMAAERIADREAAASAVGGPVADAVLGNATDSDVAHAEAIFRRASAYEQAIANGGIPGFVAPAGAVPLVDVAPHRADAYEMAANDGSPSEYVAFAGAAPPTEASTAPDPADIKFLNGSVGASPDEPVRWDDNPADIKFLTGYLDTSSRAEPVKDWKWPMPNDQIL